MNEFELQQHLQDLLDQAAGVDPDGAGIDPPPELCDLRRVITFRDAVGHPQHQSGVGREHAGSEYQITIVRSR